jgi:hypothetical protein
MAEFFHNNRANLRSCSCSNSDVLQTKLNARSRDLKCVSDRTRQSPGPTCAARGFPRGNEGRPCRARGTNTFRVAVTFVLSGGFQP